MAQVRQQAADNDVEPIPPAPAVRDELFELGQKLAFDKILSGNKNIACMSCHFPTEPFSTGDNRHLALGEGGVDLGGSRLGGGVEPRNSQPLFNLHAMDALFWDMRVEIAPDSEGHPQLRTPADAELTQAMQDVFEFGAASAQAMFPVVSRLEMRGQWFTNLPNDNELGEDLGFTEIWDGLMARLGEIPEYVAMFEAAYPGTDFEDMTFAHAANAIAGFEIRAFESRGSPWQQFLEGNDDALSDSALRGARDFFDSGCATCHSGPMLTDEEPHNTALAQFGGGKGDGQFGNDDIGFAGERFPFKLGRVPNGPGTPELNCDDGQNPHNLYGFRTPPLNNVTLSGPWGHSGQFSDLREFVAHYEDPEQNLLDYDMADHIRPSEKTLLNTRVDNIHNVLSCIDPDTQVTVPNMDDMMAFLESQTDPAARNLDWTIPDEVPSGLAVTNGEAPELTGLTEGTIQFDNIVDEDSPFAAYRRAPSARKALTDQIKQASLEEPMNYFDAFAAPIRHRGLPGVAVLDYNDDGAMDIFVTNGPGAPNMLFENQLAATGEFTFVERGVEAGVGAVATDSSGVCYGDIDNDGYDDLYVVADNGRSHLFKNNGDGTFSDISDASGATPQGTGGTSCAFGDINGDGQLDLFVGRAWHQRDAFACFMEPFSPDIQQNELYVNNGDGTFTDVSETSGILDIGGLPPGLDATITWAVAMVDYNQDGAMDIIHADDQCGLPEAPFGGLDRGFLQIFENDGTGQFTNRTVEAGTNTASGWMGLSFGDFNSDGELDFFASSFGNWGEFFAGAPVNPDKRPSRWFLGQPDGSFSDPHVGELQTTPFGWGTSARDFDNDGDADVTFQGGLDLLFFVEASNPGAVLFGDGAGVFKYDPDALQTNYNRRNTSGVAMGDLDGDGFQDLVTVSNFDIPDHIPQGRYGAADNDVFFFSAFDATANFSPIFNHVTKSDPGLAIDRFPDSDPQSKVERLFQWNEGSAVTDGTLTVEMNSADNGNNWVSVELMGAVGMISGGAVNRSGIGAVLTFTPEGGTSAIAPVLGGSSHVSQDSLVQGFGLGSADQGTVDILWPGGTKNRLYDVAHGEQLVIPELPCSYDTSADRTTYAACVDGALAELSNAGVIDASLQSRMRASALRAYDEN